MRLVWLIFILLFFACTKEKENIKEPINLTPKNTLTNQEIISRDTNFRLFKELFFLNEKVGYSIDIGGWIEVFKTSDGGKSWTVLLETQDAFGMDFVSEDKGILSARMSSHSPPFEYSFGAYQTFNGGQLWNGISVDSTLSYSDCTWSDESTIFVSTSHNILRSKDMGITWDTVMYFSDSIFGYGVRSISFANKNIGYAVSVKNVYKTINGGDSWYLISHPNFPIDTLRDALWVRNLSFYDEHHGLISTEKGLYVTNDGGISWNAPTIVGINSGPHNLYQGCYANATTMYFIGNKGISNSIDGGIYKSIDGGLSCTLINEFIEDDHGYEPYSIFMLDENMGYVSAGHTIISFDHASTNVIFVKTTSGWK